MDNEPHLSRKEKDKLRRINHFLDAAEGMMARKGYFQTSIEDVAHEAQYATGTLYKYFKSKEDLFIKLLMRKAEPHYCDLEKSVLGMSCPRKQLLAMLDAKIQFFLSHREYMNVFCREIPRPSLNQLASFEDVKKFHERLSRFIENIFMRGIAEGIFYPCSLQQARAAYIGLSNEVLLQAIESPLSQVHLDELRIFLHQAISRLFIIELNGSVTRS